MTDFGFTGQRQNDGFGLYFYNARWYDPYLNQFTQPDNIIPNPNLPTDHNRYSYARYNPVNYTDPSGHLPCFEDGYCPEGRYSEIDHIDHLLNTLDPLYRIFFDGEEILDLYLEYRKVDGWWNDNGKSDFTLEDFLGMWILFESHNADPEIWAAQAEIMASVLAQNLYAGGWNPAACGQGDCSYADVFNFIYSNVDGNSRILAGPNSSAVRDYAMFNPGLASYAGTSLGILIDNLGNKAFNRNTLISEGQNTGPSVWGNINGTRTLRSKYGIAEGVINGTAQNTVYYYNGSFAVFTVNQYNHWAALGVDMTLTYDPR